MSGGKIVKDPHRSLEADAVLLPVGRVLLFVPGKFHGTLRNGKCVYTISIVMQMQMEGISSCFQLALALSFE
jgi:hypothetical protein